MSNKAVSELMLELEKLKTRVDGLYTYQKWQMTILAGILIAVIAKRF
jgi:hypothetical protein